MIKVDYNNYLEDQEGWVENLAAKADLDSGATDREYAELAILAVNRLIAMSLRPSVDYLGEDRQEMPQNLETESHAA